MSSASDAAPPRVPAAVERFAKTLATAFKASRLYPHGSAIPAEAAAEVVAALGQALGQDSEIGFEVTKEGLVYGDTPVLPLSESFAAFARGFYSRQVAAVQFHAGLTAREVSAFAEALSRTPEEIAGQGGLDAALWDAHVTNVSAAAVSTRIVDKDLDEDTLADAAIEFDEWPPASGTIDEVLDGAAAGQKRDQRVLIRVMRDPRVVSGYLRDTLGATRGVHGFVDVVARIAALARAVRSELPGDQAPLMHSLAGAVADLEPETRSRLMRTRLLDEARRDENVAEVVQHIGLDGALDSVLMSFDETPGSLAGISRALRNLALINMSTTREQLFAEAGERMLAGGASESFTRAVIERAAPSRLAIAERPRRAGVQPVETVLGLLSMAPTGRAALVHDEDLGQIRTEAARGTTDGDVMGALVTLATIERRPEQFATVMSLLEDGIGLLIDEQEFVTASDCADALVAATEAPDVEEPQRVRIRRVLDVLAAPASARKITGALRLYRHDTPEYAACRRLLELLGGGTIEGLLEVLADEPDMSSRKAVVELISGMAAGYIPELGRRVDDPRWYFVRNVVAILGSTRSPDALSYLQRTARHEDPRVRRETIRSLSMIRASASDSVLISMLSDDDGQNVQLAARYLGSLACRAAVPALVEVALGQGGGNRESGPRVEAIEALGRISDPSTLTVLQRIGRKRWLFGGRDKDVRAAAQRALVAFGMRTPRQDVKQ